MHKCLEEYLAAVAGQLGPLPVARRNEELREIRQHLANAVFINRELGLAEEEAVASAVEQCGSPKEAAHGLVMAWRRERALERRSFVGAAASTVALTLLLPRLADAPPMQLLLMKLLLHSAWYVPVTVGLVYLAHGLSGALGGLLFPRRAVAGTLMAVTLWYGVLIARVVSGAEWVHQPSVWARDYVEFALLSVLAAWAGARWRERRNVHPTTARAS